MHQYHQYPQYPQYPQVVLSGPAEGLATSNPARYSGRAAPYQSSLRRCLVFGLIWTTLGTLYAVSRCLTLKGESRGTSGLFVCIHKYPWGVFLPRNHLPHGCASLYPSTSQFCRRPMWIENTSQQLRFQSPRPIPTRRKRVNPHSRCSVHLIRELSPAGSQACCKNSRSSAIAQ